MVRSCYRYALIVVLLVLILAIGGCGQKPKVEPPLVGQPEPAPIREEEPPEEEPWGPSEPTEQTNVVAFKGTDFLTGDEVKFTPGESNRPAIISFFSPG